MSIMVLLIFLIHIGLVLLIGLPKIFINHFITTTTTTTSDLMIKCTLTCSALPSPPSASVACQQDHLHHRHCPSCRLLSPPSPNQHLPTPKKLTQPLPEELIATKLQILPRYHFTSPTKATIFANVKSGAFFLRCCLSCGGAATEFWRPVVVALSLPPPIRGKAAVLSAGRCRTNRFLATRPKQPDPTSQELSGISRPASSSSCISSSTNKLHLSGYFKG